MALKHTVHDGEIVFEIASPNGDNFQFFKSQISFLKRIKSETYHELRLISNQSVVLSNQEHIDVWNILLKTDDFLECIGPTSTNVCHEFLISKKNIAYLRWRKNSNQNEVILPGVAVNISPEDHEALREMRNPTPKESALNKDGLFDPAKTKMDVVVCGTHAYLARDTESDKEIQRMDEIMSESAPVSAEQFKEAAKDLKRRGRPKQSNEQTISITT